MVAKSIIEIQKGLLQKEFLAEEVTKAYLTQIASTDKELGAFLHINEEEALIKAQSIDEKIRKKEPVGVLAGIPYACKDNICTKGIPTTCASKMLANFVPSYDAFAIKQLKKADGILLGKTNMDEFGMGSTNEHSAFFVARNPHNLNKSPGGSSGGSAAAVAGGEVAFALGSDTGGSIRQPASFCGVVGMKPTYGSISRNGLIAFASSLDQIGIMTRSVEENAFVLESLVGKDPLDATSIIRKDACFLNELNQPIQGMKIAIVKEFFEGSLAQDVKTAVLEAVFQYEKMGAIIKEVSIPSLKYALAAYYMISSAEASSNLARFDGRQLDKSKGNETYQNARSECFGSEVKRRIMLGSFILSAGYQEAYYKKALKARELISREFSEVFKSCDIIVAPVAPTTAPMLGEKKTPMEMYAGDLYTVPSNLANLPTLSLPCGYDGEGMPIGMQLIGDLFSEKRLYQAGFAFERERRK